MSLLLFGLKLEITITISGEVFFPYNLYLIVIMFGEVGEVLMSVAAEEAAGDRTTTDATTVEATE